MALLTLLFPRSNPIEIRTQDKKPEADGTLPIQKERQALIIDVADQITHTMELLPTDNPVEEGVDITDHMDVRPRELSYEATISEAPITIAQAIIGNVAGAVSQLPGIGGGIAGKVVTAGTAILGGVLLNESGNRVLEAFAALRELQLKKQILTIVTGLDTYSNMVLTRFVPIQNASIGDSLVCTLSFKEIRIVSPIEVPIPEQLLDPAVAESGSTVQKLGNQLTKASKNVSILQSIVNSFTGR